MTELRLRADLSVEPCAPPQIPAPLPPHEAAPPTIERVEESAVEILVPPRAEPTVSLAPLTEAAVPQSAAAQRQEPDSSPPMSEVLALLRALLSGQGCAMNADPLAAVAHAGWIEMRSPADQLAEANAAKLYAKLEQEAQQAQQLVEKARSKIAQLEGERKSFLRRIAGFFSEKDDDSKSIIDSLKLKLPALEQAAELANDKFAELPEPNNAAGDYYDCGAAFARITEGGTAVLLQEYEPENLFLGMDLRQARASTERLERALSDFEFAGQEIAGLGAAEVMQLVILANQVDFPIDQLVRDFHTLQAEENMTAESAALLLDAHLRYELPLDSLLAAWGKAYEVEGVGEYSAAQLAIVSLRSGREIKRFLQAFAKAYSEPGINEYAATELAGLAVARDLNLDKLIKNCRVLDQTEGLGAVSAARLVSASYATNTAIPDLIKTFTQFYEVRGMNQQAALVLTCAAAKSKRAPAEFIKAWRSWFGPEEGFPAQTAAQLAICMLERSIPQEQLEAAYSYTTRQRSLKEAADPALAIIACVTAAALGRESDAHTGARFERCGAEALTALNSGAWQDLSTQFYDYGINSALFSRR